jgi:hypothetical protein
MTLTSLAWQPTSHCARSDLGLTVWDGSKAAVCGERLQLVQVKRMPAPHAVHLMHSA